MSCFNNLIGIRSDKDATLSPRSGLYLEDLEGINLSMAADVADGDHKTGVDLLKNKLDFAYGLVQDDITNILHPHFRFNSIIESKEVGKFVDDYSAPVAAERGLRIERVKSRLTKIYIRRITLLLNTTVVDKEIKVIDGSKEVTYTFSGNAGEQVEVPIDYKAKERIVFVVMDNSDVEVNNSTLYDSKCGCRRNDYDYYYVRGWDGSFNQSLTYGMRADINLECDEEDLSCLVIHKLDYISLYRAGIEILKELISSDRLNYYTIFGEEEAAAKLEEWKDEYNNRLNNLIPQLRSVLTNIDDICLTCTKSRITNALP